MQTRVFFLLASLPCFFGAEQPSRPLNVFDYMTPAQIARVRAGTSTDDTAAVQAAFDALQAYSPRSLYFPAGTYHVKKTLRTCGLTSCRIYGATGFDGAESVVNGGPRTRIKWIGADESHSAVVRHTRANGLVWSAISIDGNHLAGYGLQFDSDQSMAGAIRNVVELCSINYTQRDGLIIGPEDAPVAAPGDRQFFAYTVRQVLCRGCKRAGIHVNEWNADAHVYDQVWGFPDDCRKWNCDNLFWFERGGNASELRSCESSATTASQVEGSGYMIKVGSTAAHTGCQGLTVTNAWSEENGGFFWANTVANIKNPFVFLNCKAYGYGTGTHGQAVYIMLKGGAPAAVSFIGCHLNSDVKIDTPNLTSEFFTELGNYWGPRAAVIDFRGGRSQRGFADIGNTDTAGKALVSPRFAKLIRMTLTASIPAIYVERIGDPATPVTLIVKQDGLGGRTIGFGDDQWADARAIPQPAPAANAVTTYTFVSDGSKWHLSSVSTAGRGPR